VATGSNLKINKCVNIKLKEKKMTKYKVEEGVLVKFTEGKLKFDKRNRGMSGYPTLSSEEKDFSWVVGYDGREREPWTFETFDNEYEPNMDTASFKNLDDLIKHMSGGKYRINIKKSDFAPFLDVI